MTKTLSKREQKKILSRRAIMDAAVTLFTEKGVSETSVADIMSLANLGLGTFYNYFASKEEVLMELLNCIVQDIEARRHELKSEQEEIGPVLEELVLYVSERLSQNRFVLPLFLRAAEHAAMPSAIEQAERGDKVSTPGFKEIFESLTREGQASGEFRKDIPAGVITEMFHSLFQAAAFSRLGLSFDENIRLKMRLIVDGMKVKR